MTPQQKSGRKTKESISPKWNEQFSEQVKQTVRKAESWEIDAAVSPVAQQQIKALGAEARTKELNSSSQPSNAVEAKVVEILRGNKIPSTAQVTVGPSEITAQRVTGLNMSIDSLYGINEASSLVTNQFQSLIGEGVRLAVTRKRATKEGASVQFEQILNVDGRELPLFETQVGLFYTNGISPSLSTLVNNTFPTNRIRFDDTEIALDTNEVREVVARRLKLPTEQLKESRQGIYFVGGNPGKGRIAYSVPVNMGTNHKDIKVYVDAATGQILEIK